MICFVSTVFIYPNQREGNQIVRWKGRLKRRNKGILKNIGVLLKPTYIGGKNIMVNNTANNQEAIKTVNDLIKEIKVAMFTTISSDNKIISRPMQTQEVEFDGELWFLTMKDTDKYQEITSNPNVNLAYAGKSYVSISGTAEFIEDAAKKKEYWNPVFDKMLDTSYDDPNVVLIKVDADSAEYWDSGDTLKSVKTFVKKLTNKDTEKDHKEINDTVDFN